jgi:hypothetical protein
MVDTVRVLHVKSMRGARDRVQGGLLLAAAALLITAVLVTFAALPHLLPRSAEAEEGPDLLPGEPTQLVMVIDGTATPTEWRTTAPQPVDRPCAEPRAPPPSPASA